jgi:hypothetical protein
MFRALSRTCTRIPVVLFVLALLCTVSIADTGADSIPSSGTTAETDTLSSHAIAKADSDTLPWVLMGATLFIVLALTRRRHTETPDE